MGNRFIAEFRGPYKAACTIVCKGHAANKKETRQIIKKRNQENIEETMQTKQKTRGQKRNHANIKENTQKNRNHANKKENTQIKKRDHANKNENTQIKNGRYLM